MHNRNCEAHIYDKEVRELMTGGGTMINRPTIRVVYLATMSVSRLILNQRKMMEYEYGALEEL